MRESAMRYACIIFFSMTLFSFTYAEGSMKNNEAAELKHFVERGAALMAQKGEASFDLFREKGSEWFQGDRYLFVWDLNGLRYVYPPDRAREQEQVEGIKDIDGKPIGRLFIEITTPPNSGGWVHYRWPKPGGKTPSWKSTYLMHVRTPSAKEYLIGSGAYDMPVQPSFVMDVVHSAVKLIEKEGVEAFDTLRDKRSQYLYQDTYLFVISEEGTELLNVAFPKLEGRNVLHYHDGDGNYYVKKFIEVAKSQDHGWVDYLWPKPGDVEKYHKSAYVKKAMIEGKMVVVCAGLYLD